MSEDKKRSSTMVFVNRSNEVLAYLRDNKPQIRYPNMWDLTGGWAEDGETPEQTVMREMSEELPNIPLGDYRQYREVEFPDRIDSIFWTRLDMPIEEIRQVMAEGRRNSATWVSEEMAEKTEFAFGFNAILKEIYRDLRAGRLS